MVVERDGFRMIFDFIATQNAVRFPLQPIRDTHTSREFYADSIRFFNVRGELIARVANLAR